MEHFTYLVVTPVTRNVKTSLTVLMSSTLAGKWLRLHARQCSVSHAQKRCNSFFLRQNTLDFIVADECASYSSDLNPLGYCIWGILQDLVYKGRRLPFANLQDLRDNQNKWIEMRAPLRQFENPFHNEKNDRMRLESRTEARFSTFPLIAVTGYWSHAVRRAEQ